jgi:hypothetical protein
VRGSDTGGIGLTFLLISVLCPMRSGAQTFDRLSPPMFSKPCSPDAFRTPQTAYPLTFSETLLRAGNKERDRIFSDFGNLYNKKNAKNYGVALLGAGILANTKLDGQFQRWHNENIRSNFSKEWSECSKIFGEGKYFIPITVSTMFIGRFLQERSGHFDEKFRIVSFADRTARGYTVGAPTLLIGQWALGAARPRDDGNSYWHPFQNSHGISGHAFIGAVPFMTAAQMTDKPVVKGLFYTMSTFCAWSRVKDDAHYLSQALLGWYLAYLSVRSVSETEGLKPLPRGLTLFPVMDGNSVGFGFLYQR